MSDFLSPLLAPVTSPIRALSGIFGLGDSGPSVQPVIQQLPSTQSAFTKKYSTPSLTSLLSTLPPALSNSLVAFDRQRALRGQQPLSPDQTANVLKTYLQQSPATPPPDEGLLSRAFHDIQSIAGEIPKLPVTLAKEVTQLPEAPAQLSKALSSGSLSNILAGLETVPGVRMIPGLYTAATLANEGPGGLLKHPVFTALDVLPYAEKPTAALIEGATGKLARVAEARPAVDSALADINASRDAAGLKPFPVPSNTRLALRTSPTLQALSETPAGIKVRSMFGTLARDTSQLMASEVNKVHQQFNPDTPDLLIPPDIAPIRSAIKSASEWSKSIPQERMIDLTKGLELDRNAVLQSPLSDVERGFVNDMIDHTNQLADWTIGKGFLPEKIEGEVFAPDQAAKIRTARRAYGRIEALTNARESINTSLGTDTLPTIDPSTIVSEHLPRTQQLQVAQGYAHALDAAGFDADPLIERIKLARSDKSITPSMIRDDLQSTLDNPTPRPVLTPDQMVETLRPHTRVGSIARIRGASRVIEDIRNGNYQDALTTYRATLLSHANPIPESAEVLDSLIRARDRASYLDNTSGFTPKNLERSATKLSNIENRIAPARFQPQIEAGIQRKLQDLYASDPTKYYNGQTATQLIERGLAPLVTSLAPDVYRSVVRDVTSTWKDLRAEGIDPVFVHRVGESAANSIANPRISDVLKVPSQIKARTGDATPYVQNASVALSHQGLELLTRLGTERFVSNILDIYGTRASDALPEFLPTAETLASKDPSLSIGAHAERLFQRKYEKYDPASIFPHSTARFYSSPTSEIFIPKVVAGTLKQMFHDGSYRLTGLLDPVMRLFRTAVLPLSPRWHVNNIGGGAMLEGAEIGPVEMVRQWSRAREFVKSGEYESIAGMPPAGFGSQPRDIIEWNKRSSLSDRIAATHDFKGGQTLRKLWDAARPLRDATGNLIQRSYDFNGLVDDQYRAIAYLSGRDKALTAGMTTCEAEQAGIALVRKVLPEWDRMTPMERTIMRSVFPFYSWAKFITAYAYRFPIDHPFRVAVTASLARAEMADSGDALPSRFMDGIFLGSPDSQGMVSQLSLSGINPFRDVSNYFTLAGFTGQLNPVLQTILESVGVDPSKGSQDLYPDITYDPVTGRLVPHNPSLLSSFVGNVLPQSQILTALIGVNSNFKEILRSNPEAAASMLRSAAGLPVLFRNVNVPQEAFKAELQREQNTTEVRNEALRTGDLSTAQHYPTLRAYFRQLAQLQSSNPQSFQPYTPGADAGTQTGLSETARRAFIGLNIP